MQNLFAIPFFLNLSIIKTNFKKKLGLFIHLFVFDFLQNLNKFMTSVISWLALQPIWS